MSRYPVMSTCLIAAATAAAFLQPCSTAMAQAAPSAYVYVSSNYSGSNNRVVGLTADFSGKLTQIGGSPWADNITDMAVNGTYLFGSDNVPNDGGRNIYAYRIVSNGALKYVGATDIQVANSSVNSCDEGRYLTLDHSGSYLYVWASGLDQCNSEDAYLSFAVNSATGKLTYLSNTTPNHFSLGYPLTVAADNKYAYSAPNMGMYGAICDFYKGSNGAFVDLNSNNCNNPWPAGRPSNWSEYGGYISADTTNHLAIDIDYIDPNGISYYKIATYAINTTNGTLTTSSTFSNMPTSQVQDVAWIMMSPSGKLLAVGGSNGLQLFNFHPSGQATANTGLIRTGPITQMYWDKKNHLYAISNADNAVYVFNSTTSGTTQVSGSPFTVTRPVSLIVQPK